MMVQCFAIHSSLQIVRKLMLDYGGLDNLVELVSSSDEEAVQQTAILSLVFLLQSIKCQSSLRVGKPALCVCLSVHTVLVRAYA